MSKAAYWQRGEAIDFTNTTGEKIEANEIVTVGALIGVVHGKTPQIVRRHSDTETKLFLLIHGNPLLSVSFTASSSARSSSLPDPRLTPLLPRYPPR